MEDSGLSLGRTRSATAANVRVWSAATPHSHLRARTAGSAPRSGSRVVANTDQVYALKQFLERSGPDATTKEIEVVAAETGLDAKWIRQWIRRQVNGSKGKSKKGKKNAGLSPSETSTPSQTSRGPTPEGLLTPLLPTHGLEKTGTDVRNFAFIAQPLDSFEAGSKARQYSGQSTTGSYGGITSLSSPTPGHGYGWNQTPFSRENQDGAQHPQTHSSLMHIADPGASFMVPFRSDADSQHTTGISSPDSHTNVAQWSTYTPAHPRSIREAELFGIAARVPSQYSGSGAGLGGSHISPGASTTVFSSTALGPASRDPNVPECLTAGSAYLYRLFHERLADASPVAPPQTPHLEGAMYMAGLTRPSVAPLSSAMLLPAPVSMFSSVPGYAVYPVAYSMSFYDLIRLTKTVRGTPDKNPGSSAGPFVPSEITQRPGTSRRALSILLEMTNVFPMTENVDKIPRPQNEYSPPPTSTIGPTQSDFLRVVIRAASSDAAPEGDTEDEHEAVTRCEGADLALPLHDLHGGKGKGKKVGQFSDTPAVIVEAADIEVI